MKLAKNGTSTKRDEFKQSNWDEGKRSLLSQIDTESQATQVKAKASFQLESKRYNEDEIHQCNDKALIQVVERGNDFFFSALDTPNQPGFT